LERVAPGNSWRAVAVSIFNQQPRRLTARRPLFYADKISRYIILSREWISDEGH